MWKLFWWQSGLLQAPEDTTDHVAKLISTDGCDPVLTSVLWACVIW